MSHITIIISSVKNADNPDSGSLESEITYTRNEGMGPSEIGQEVAKIVTGLENLLE